MQKGFTPLLIFVPAFILLAGILAALYYFGKLPIKLSNSQPKACTLEAKLCPDGSSVGRTGPNCEFTLCPSVSSSNSADETANWQIYKQTDYGYQIKYPVDWTVEEDNENVYIRGVSSGMVIVNIRVFRNPSGIPVNKWIADNLSGPYDKPGTISDVVIPASPNSTIAGKPAFRMEFTASQAPSSSMVFVAAGDYVFLISSYDYPGDDKELYPKILSTFKFLP